MPTAKEKILQEFENNQENFTIKLNNNLKDGVADFTKEEIKEFITNASEKECETFFKVNGATNYSNLAKEMEKSKNTPPKTPSDKSSSKNYKKIILEIFRGENLTAHNKHFSYERVNEVQYYRIDRKITIELVEKNLTEEIARSFISSNGEILKRTTIENWLESLLSGPTENNDNQDHSQNGKPNQDNSKPKNQNGNHTQTTDLNENWEKGVQKLISGKTDLTNFFQRLIERWKRCIEWNKQVDRKEWDEKDQRNLDEIDRQKEGSIIEVDELKETYILVPKLEDFPDKLRKFSKSSIEKGNKESIIKAIEKKYNIKLTADYKKKANNLALFLTRVVMDNCLASDPFTQEEMKNSWEKKILDLASQSFADNAERKIIAQRIAYHLISRDGFSTDSEIVNKKAEELKSVLSQYQASPDLSEIKKIVSQALQIFYAASKTQETSYSVSWTVPNNYSEVSTNISDDDWNHSLAFPVFPEVKRADGIKINRIKVLEVESWDKSKPTEPDNIATDKDTPIPDFSQTKEDIKNEKEAEQKKETEEVKNATNDLKNENLPEAERFSKLEEVEEKEGNKSYQTNEADIKNSKKDLFTKNESQYRKTMAKVFRKKLTDNGLTEKELSEAVEKWENDKSNDWEKVEQKEKEINQKIGSSVAKKRVSEIEKRIESALKTGDKNKMSAVLKDLLGLFNEAQNNIYLSNYKSQLSQKIKNLEKAISQEKTDTSPDKNKGFWQPKVLIPIGVGAVILVVLAVVIIRSRKKKKIKSR
ncbi:MAG: hypothetical protein I3273_06725 [Candidatus Moeniiplasma glomeromycotorum]|nr:hypothetical protein [Candidatus Moeniiplasma glomeromycotorum]MCE8169779.1 hypothetical protein [Candidatus Moeniiplasma glomeromycotorum]